MYRRDKQVRVKRGILKNNTVSETGRKIIRIHQREFQGPKMEVMYNIRPYFVGIFPCRLYIGLHRPYAGLTYGRYLQYGFLKKPLSNI